MSDHSFSKTYISNNTDIYFTKTKNIAQYNGDTKVIYAIFLRRKVIYSCQLAIDLINAYALHNNLDIQIYENYKEGDFVPANKCLFFLQGSFIELSELETLLLQKIGLPCVCAYNTYEMCKYLPQVTFISMLARHCANPDMANMAEYGVSVGSMVAQQLHDAQGFLGSSITSSTKFFATEEAFGTMPHSLIGYANSTLKAAQMFYQMYHQNMFTVLVDYFGQEISDSLEICNFFTKLIKQKNLGLRIDTHKNRYLEGLNATKSASIITKYYPDIKLCDFNENQIEHIMGQGVSLAAILHLKEQLNINGFQDVKIVVSSGFDVEKCKTLSQFTPPIDIIGTGSTLPKHWSEVFATADIISYNGKLQVKLGREDLIQQWLNYQKEHNLDC